MRDPFIKLMELRKLIEKRALYPKQVYYNDKEGVVAILWSDESRSKARCVLGDTFDLEIGVDIAIANRLVNKKMRNKLAKNAQLQPSKIQAKLSPKIDLIGTNINQKT